MWRLLSVLLALWATSAHGQVKPCKFPKIRHGGLYDESRYGQYFLALFGNEFTYYCDHDYVTPSGSHWGHIRCTHKGWKPGVPCRRKCIFDYLENGKYGWRAKTYYQGESLIPQCHSGFSLPNGESVMRCTENGWSPPPRCVRVQSCARPVFKNAVTERNETWFKLHDQLLYECKPGYENREGRTNGSIVCNIDGWSEKPTCFAPKEKCGHPPGIDNGDITSMPLIGYAPGSSVEYQCQSYYKLQGNKTILCSDGQWSTPPRCLDPCILSEDVMNENNVQLRQSDGREIYFPSGEFIEFICKSGYKQQTPPESFRAHCTEGNLIYPTCR